MDVTLSWEPKLLLDEKLLNINTYFTSNTTLIIQIKIDPNKILHRYITYKSFKITTIMQTGNSKIKKKKQNFK